MGFGALFQTNQALEAFFALLCQCHSIIVKAFNTPLIRRAIFLIDLEQADQGGDRRQ